MTHSMRGAFFLTLAASALVLTGCSSERFGSNALTGGGTPQNVQPVATSSVSSQSLPPIGTNGTTGTSGYGTPAYPAAGDQTTGDQANAQPSQQMPEGSFVTLNSNGAPTTGSGRNLTDGLTVEKLLGTWTVVAGAGQCRLNLTQTAKPGTGRYRASVPGCAIPALSGVASWQLAGTQVQLFDNNGNLMGTLIQSGNRFIGTLAGGVPVSMLG